MPRRPSEVSPSSSAPQVLQTLQWMRKNNLKPVPLHFRSKAAMSRDYVSVDYQPPSDDYWRGHNCGVGCVTGPIQGGPVDGDLDCVEAIFFAPRFLPSTSAVFGRASKPKSHYLYRVDVSSFDKRTFLDPVNGAVIIELRGDGGHQTVFPGSMHETTGEEISWSGLPFPEIPTVSAAALDRGARKVALATILVRHIWTEGYRNEITKHLTGLLFYLEWALEEIEELITAVMEYAEDDDKSRIATVRVTYRRGENGKKITGAGVLRKQLKNDTVVDRVLELAGSPIINLLNEYNDRFAVVSLKGKFRIADTDVAPGDPPVFYQKDDWLNLMGTDYSDVVNDKGVPVPKARLWLSNSRRRTYMGADFMPGVEDTDRTLNLWTGWSVEPVPGDCSAWLELLRTVVCGDNEPLYTWMLHWFANILREPMNKSLTAPVVIGIEGAGKSLLLGYFGKILGKSYVTVTNEEHIYGRFNNHLGSALLLHSEEALYGGEKKHASIIRSLITDEVRMFEQKGIDAQQVRNYLRLILTSNDIHAAPARAGDRRYTVIDMHERKASNELIQRVLDELHSNGPAHLFHYFKNMEYDPRIPRTNVKTDSLLAIKSLNMSPLENWWHDVLMSGSILPDYLNWATKPEKEYWPETVSSVALHVALTVYMREHGQRNIPNHTALAYNLNKLTGTVLKRSQRSFDNPLIEDAPQIVRQMNERQSAIINMPTLGQCREAFEKHLGQQIDWPEEPAPFKFENIGPKDY